MTQIRSDEERERFVDNVSGHLTAGGHRAGPRAFVYWRSIGRGVGDRIEAKVSELPGHGTSQS